MRRATPSIRLPEFSETRASRARSSTSAAISWRSGRTVASRGASAWNGRAPWPAAPTCSERSMQPMEETTAFQPFGTGETFDAGMLAAGVTYARSFTDKFSAGLTANMIHTGLADLSQQTFSVDLGTP